MPDEQKDVVTITFPTYKNATTPRAVPLCKLPKGKLGFVAAGRAEGQKLKKVKAFITKHSTGTKTWMKKRLFIAETTGPQSEQGYKYYRWAVLFEIEPGQEGDYKLNVLGTTNDEAEEISGADDDLDNFRTKSRWGKVSDVAAQLLSAPEIEYPPDPHTIDAEERQNFGTYGSTDQVIIAAEVGEDTASYIYDDPQTEHFFFAQFDPLESEGEQTLYVRNDTSLADSCSVTIE